MQMLPQEIRIKPIVQLWKHCCRGNKVEAGHSNACRWRFWFISVNLFCMRTVLLTGRSTHL